MFKIHINDIELYIKNELEKENILILLLNCENINKIKLLLQTIFENIKKQEEKINSMYMKGPVYAPV